MHVVLGLLGVIVTILILLNRLADAGIDLGGLNPFLWQRRRRWRKEYEGNPVFKVTRPMEATAILMVAVVKADGDMTMEEKSRLLDLFESEFKLSKKDAAGLLVSSAHLLGDGLEVRSKVGEFLAPSKSAFTPDQVESAIELVSRAAGSPRDIHPAAQELVDAVGRELAPVSATQGGW